MKRCLECKRATGRDTRRGLCRPCYRDPDIRYCYPSSIKGGWVEGAKAWDIREDQLLMDLFDGGLSDKQIAEQMCRSGGSITKRRQRLGMAVSRTRQLESLRRVIACAR